MAVSKFDQKLAKIPQILTNSAKSKHDENNP